MNSAQAGELLDRSRHHLAYLARTGRLRAQRHGGLWWIDPADVIALRDERTTWISWAVAADLVGCPISAVVAAVRQGAIETRGGGRSPRPSLRRSSVEAWATTWAEQEERRRAEALPCRALLRRNKPPLDGHVWLSRTETALVLGVSAKHVSQLTRAGKVPAIRAGHRHWYRRDHVERVAAARTFRARWV
ncbi:helix-turn-helix domain-containing protein [Nocardioides sp.]|uniref:helix-turn-helix domain-containing protein n=1 Tax=Nocardioides sp. TaxID=35761 RepID=UPI002735B1DB|nr:helix-turn-helix domain-containing protein [Nocardioides sp.]MDP3893293.1 helix-turn-helix domain-containing protein [Nocardioides sp.]